MRDIALTAFIFGSIPFLLRRPDLAVLMWTWISLMAPHRLTWGFAFDMRFALVIGLVLLMSVVISKEEKRIPWSPMTVTWALFVVWMCVTSVFALNPAGVMAGLDKTLKIQISSFIILMMMKTEWRLKAFVAVVTLSIAFYGVKGGIFTLRGGGGQLVWGPSGSFIRDNNALAMALVAVMPLLWFLRLYAPNKWIARGMVISMMLCAFSVIGSNSRGAFLGAGAMALFLVWKSPRRVPVLLVMAVLIPLLVSFAPQEYWDRMGTIETYEEDNSAMGRLRAWETAIKIALDRPLVGGGFNTFTPDIFARYTNREWARDVHSVYFAILGEHGFIGFALFMALATMAYVGAGRTARRAAGIPDAKWQADLASLVQVSLVGYAVAGAFLRMAYFDLLYNLFAMVVLNRIILERKLAEGGGVTAAPVRTPLIYGQPRPASTAAEGSSPRGRLS